jgi:2-dehydro-3-deoxyphosphogluconate aldolase/(4S)-4-hydroxy-2-oxoglutarate aldolase
LNIEDIMRTAPVIPVLVIEDAATARPLAEALVKGGLRVLEVTMRTGRRDRGDRGDEEGRGRDRRRRHGGQRRAVRPVMDAGAEFIVSPGSPSGSPIQSSPAACRSCRAPPPPETSCAGSISG